MFARAVFHMDVSDGWTMEDFAQLLSRVDYTYARLNGFFTLEGPRRKDLYSEAERLAGAPRRARKALQEKGLPIEEGFLEVVESTVGSGTGQSFQDFMRALEQDILQYRGDTALEVRGIQIHSPGFVEAIGALNPLKVITDFITENRRINLDRYQGQLDRDVKIRELGQRTVQALIERGAFDHGPEQQKLLEFYVYYSETRPLREMQVLASDPRIEDVYVEEELSGR
jgi:hypothetical protein